MTAQISWHRGGRELAPGASLRAFERAAESGAEWIEVDVRRTADGVLVCVHDPTVPGLGAVSTLRYSSLPASQRRAVPSFQDFLEALHAGGGRAGDPLGSGVHLDLKGRGHELEAVEAMLASGRRFFVTTLHDESVKLLRDHFVDIEAFLSLPRVERGHGAVGLARMWCGDLWPYGRLRRSGATGVAVQYVLANAWLRRWCRRRSLTVLVWTVDSTSGLKRWLRRPNVDIVTTNRPVAAGLLPRGPGRRRAAAVADRCRLKPLN